MVNNMADDPYEIYQDKRVSVDLTNKKTVVGTLHKRSYSYIILVHPGLLITRKEIVAIKEVEETEA